ncbi:hypothetical protein FOL47_006048, partial [Perkinsus chesapeaki]
DIAETQGISRSAVCKIIAKGAPSGSKEPKETRGRKQKLNDRQKRQIIREFSRNPDLTCSAVPKICNIQGADFVKLPTAPRLTEAHKAARVAFASKHLEASTDFSTWIFSDEKRFNLDGPD